MSNKSASTCTSFQKAYYEKNKVRILAARRAKYQANLPLRNLDEAYIRQAVNVLRKAHEDLGHILEFFK